MELRKQKKALAGALSSFISAAAAWSLTGAPFADVETAFVSLGAAAAGYIITFWSPKNEEV